MHTKGSGATYGRCADCNRTTRLGTLTRNGGMCRTCRSVEYAAREEDRDARDLLVRAFVAVTVNPERGRVARSREHGAIGYVRVSNASDAHAGGYHYATLTRAAIAPHKRTHASWTPNTSQDLSARVAILTGARARARMAELARTYSPSPTQGDNATRTRIRTWDATARMDA